MFKKMLNSLDNNDIRIARRIEACGLATFSQIVKTMYRAVIEDDGDALVRLVEWERHVEIMKDDGEL